MKRDSRLRLWILDKLKLQRQSNIVEYTISQSAGKPTHVDITMRSGQRFVGFLDPWWPNPHPLDPR